MSPAETRKSYMASFKIKVIDFAKENGNRAAERLFYVSEKLVRDWRKKENELRSTKKSKMANRGCKPRWPILEEKLRSWVIEQRAGGHGLSTIQVRLKGQALAKEMEIEDFCGGPIWCFRFMRRNQLSIRTRTTMCQKLPSDFQEKLDSFRNYVQKAIGDNNISLEYIVNMDEVPLTFDIPINRCVDEKGVKSVNIRTTGHEKSSFTVVLACCANGYKLPPMIIFKRKTKPKGIFPSTVVIMQNVKGWMDEGMMGEWLQRCYSKRPGGFLKKEKALLIMDSMRAHITENVVKKIKFANSIPIIIPGGMTKLLQPLDISVTRSFKAELRKLWEKWMREGDHSFTTTGRMRCATFGEVASWVDSAWKSITVQTITCGFKKAEIVDPLAEKTQNISEVLTEENYDVGEDDSNETFIEIPQQVYELFQSDTEDEDFDGFV